MKLQKYLALYLHLSHPQEVFPGGDGRFCFEPRDVAVAAWWELHLGGAVLPARDTGAQQAAPSSASASFPAC